ncbi:MAG TPA: hypothetical protein VGG92_02415 [Caulobacteraceae bacterium]
MVKELTPKLDQRNIGGATNWLEAPHHARVRGPFVQALYGRATTARPELERRAKAHLDSLSERPTPGVLTAFSMDSPIQVVSHLGGTDAERSLFHARSDIDMTALADRTMSDDAEITSTSEKLTAYADRAAGPARRPVGLRRLPEPCPAPEPGGSGRIVRLAGTPVLPGVSVRPSRCRASAWRRRFAARKFKGGSARCWT